MSGGGAGGGPGEGGGQMHGARRSYSADDHRRVLYSSIPGTPARHGVTMWPCSICPRRAPQHPSDWAKTVTSTSGNTIYRPPNRESAFTADGCTAGGGRVASTGKGVTTLSPTRPLRTGAASTPHQSENPRFLWLPWIAVQKTKNPCVPPSREPAFTADECTAGGGRAGKA